MEPGSMIERASELVAAVDREDLQRRLAAARERFDDPTTRVLVVGEFKQGKSALVNALVNAPVCQVGDDVATAVPTVVSWAQSPTATLVEGDEQLDDEGEAPLRTTRREVPLERFDQEIRLATGTERRQRLLHAEAGLPREILSGGLTLIDTPGVGGLRTSHAAATVAALPSADAVLFVSDASAELSAAELKFLHDVVDACPHVTCVMSKTDIAPEWRRLADINRDHLRDAGIDATVVPVSSVLRDAAMRSKDVALNEESGFPELVRVLRQGILAHSRDLARQTLTQDVRLVSRHLRLAVESELDALQNPEELPARIADLERAKAQADALRNRGSRWQVTLGDGMTDLMSDLEHDLRDRLRGVTHDAEDSIDTGDPGKEWEAFSQWLEEQVGDALAETFRWTEDNTRWITTQVAQHFADDAAESVPRMAVGSTSGLTDRARPLVDIDPGVLNVGQKVLIGMRGSYGGVLMFGLLTGLAGFALVNPISISAGLLLGTKAYSDDRANRLKRRQNEAKMAVRRYIDDVTFQVTKQLKDRLRLVHRTLRDHFTEVAGDLQRSSADALRQANTAAKASDAERAERIRFLKKHRSRVVELEEALGTARPEAQGAVAS